MACDYNDMLRGVTSVTDNLTYKFFYLNQQSAGQDMGATGGSRTACWHYPIEQHIPQIMTCRKIKQ